MRKVLAVVTVAALVLAAFAVPASAKKHKKKGSKPRTAESAYDSPAIGLGGVGGACFGANGCAQFPVAGEEAYMILESEDSSGRPVFLRVTQDTNGDGTSEGIASVCGASTEPIVITPGVAVNVFVYAVGANPPCPGPATSGKVKATFATNPAVLTN